MASEKSKMATTEIKETVELKKNLGLFNGVAIIVGVIIGSGIFVSPKGVLIQAGSVYASLGIWSICGIISLFGAMCYAELGTCILKSGADYAYINEAFGSLPAFLYVWVASVILIPTHNAINGLAFAYYFLQPFFPDCEPPDVVIRLLAALCISLITFVNCWNVKLAAMVQNVFTVAKVLALILVIAMGVVQIYKTGGDLEYLQNGFEGTNRDPAGMAMAFYSGLYSYAGWNYLNFVTEELKDPYKDLPRAIWISIPLVTVVYVFANVAYFTVLSPKELLASNAVAVSFADQTLGVMAWCMPLFVAASTFGGLNGGIFSASRVFFVAARNGHFPGALACINIKYFTPISALLFMGVTSLMMLCSSDLYSLINYTAFVEAAFTGFSVSGLLYLRYKKPDIERPIKVALFFPIFFLCITIFLVLTPLLSTPFECLMGVAVTATGIPFYVLGITWKNKPKTFQQFVGQLTITSQKLLYVVEEEKQE